MKRNLSSQAIRAMAIGMAVTLGSATAVSGVVTGTVVNVYAADFNTANFNATAEKEGENLKITINRDGAKVFKADDANKKLTGLVVKNGGKDVFSSESGGSLDNITSDANTATEKLVITIPKANIIDGSLAGNETSLTITKLTSTDIKYGDSGSEAALSFDAGNLNVTTSGAIGIDKTAPTITADDAVYDRAKKTITLTASEALATYNENNANTHKFTVKNNSSQNQTVNNVKVENSAATKIVITLDAELVDGTYTIGYDADVIADANGNKLAKNNSLKTLTVSNTPSDNTAPTITGDAVYDRSAKTITLTSDKDLNDKTEANKDTHGFVVKNSKKQEQEIKQVTVKGKEITIELNGQDALADDMYTISYTKKDGSEFIVAKDGGKLDTNNNLATFKVSAEVKPPVQGDLTATTVDGNYTFKKIGSNDKEVALVGFTTVQTRAAQTNTFENGVLTAEGKTYTLTQIGDGTKVDGLTTKALEGHTSNVTTIKENAFNGNTNVTTLTFPNVTKVEANAFSGATSLTSIDLGSASTGLTVATDAFKGASNLKNIATSTENKDKVDAAIKGSNLQDTTTVITDENSNDTNATIAKDKFYQTKEGLIFKGLSNKELSFEGKDKFTAPTKPNGLTGETKEKAYLVTYKYGVVSLKAGENTQTPVEESFDVSVKDKKLTFKPLTDGSSVALANVGNASVMRAAAANTLQDGVLTVNGKQYNFTQIGDGTTPLATDFDANTVLAGNLDKVTTVAKDAFKGNTTLTEISLPNVTTIAEGAFKGTSNLAKVFLGDEVVTVANGAFENTKSDIKVSSNNETTLGNLKKPGTGLDGNKVKNAAPFVTSAIINNDAKDKIVLTFSENVYAPQNITPGDFIVEGGSSYTVSGTEGLLTDKGQAKNTIKLTLNKQVKAGEKLTLKYTKSGNGIKDTATQEAELANITTGLSITNNVEDSVELPAVKTATVEDANKDKIVLTLDKAPASNFEDADKDNFTLKVTGGTTSDQQIQTVSSSGTTVTITLNKALAKDNTDIKLSYKGDKIRTLNDQVVTNNIGKVQAVDVTVDGVTVDGTALKITVNNGKTLKDEQTLGKDGFTVTKGTANTPVDVSSAAVARNVITLTLGAAIEASDTEIKVAYNGINSKLLENGTNAPIAAIASQFVVNTKDATAPTLLSATASGSNTSYIITLPVSEPIKQTADPKSKFAVTVTGSNASGKTAILNSVTIDNSTKKTITLNISTNKALDISKDKFQVAYTKGTELVDLKGNQLEAKTLDDITISAARTAAIVSSSDSDLVAIAPVQVINQNGDVTSITSVKGATATEINSILTDKLTKINSGAFKDVDKDLTLDFSKVNISNLNIERGAFSGAKGLNITGVNSSDTEKLAKMIGSSSDIKIDGKTTQDIIKDNSNSGNGGSGSGGGSSSGGSGGGSGANIGTITNKKPNTEETTSQGNKNETVVENKQLSFDVIKLPSVEGEAKVFGDVSANHWAKSYIDKLSTARIINGSNGMFNPNGQTKRADVTVMLVNLLGLTPEANNKFADVNASAYYAPYVGTASTYGIVNGSNGMFNPQGVISRQDTMVMIAQILKGLNLNVNADTTALSQFGDASKVSAYANESVAILVNSGIISGNNGKLNPTAPVTRAEMATIMSKLYDVLASANK